MAVVFPAVRTAVFTLSTADSGAAYRLSGYTRHRADFTVPEGEKRIE